MDAKIRLHICLPHICVEPVYCWNFLYACPFFCYPMYSVRKLVNSYQSQTYGQRLPQLYIYNADGEKKESN